MLSFSLTFTEAFSLASQLITDLLPVYLLPLGITLGLMILGVIMWGLRQLDLFRHRH